MAVSSLMASQTLMLRSPIVLSPHSSATLSLPLSLSPPRTLSLLQLPKPLPALSLRRPTPPSLAARSPKVFASSSSSSPVSGDPPIPNPPESPIAESTRTITAILAVTLSVSRILASKLYGFGLKLKGICANPSPEELAAIQTIQESLVCTAGPLFFAYVNDRPSTPMTVVAAGMAKWIEIYSAVLMVRVLLSWFPTIPWERQPLCAIRDLCDPYLSIFRHLIPPLFNTLDVSPILAITALASLSKLLKITMLPSSRKPFT